MAILTVGAGTLLLGKDWIGLPAAVGIDWVLWTIGTVLGLGSAVLIPYLAFTRHENKPDAAFGGWLMPIVPPMVSASTGALLLPYAAAGQVRETLLWACYGMFGLSLLTSIVVITLIWNRLAQHKIGAAAMVPTLWIVLGPVGQSITAVNLPAPNIGTASSRKLRIDSGRKRALVEMLIDSSCRLRVPILRLKQTWRPPVLPYMTMRPSLAIESNSAVAVSSPIVIRPMSMP